MSLRDRIKNASTIKESEIFGKSTFINEQEMIPTDIPIVNIALSGSITGGLTSGHTAIAGPSRHFKTSFALTMAAGFQQKYKDEEHMIIFYDSEFGAPQSYFHQFGVDTDFVLHTPVTTVEQLKTDIVNQLKEIKKTDKVLIIIDSIGNIASKKELDDAESGKNVADMTRAKALKSLFRMITTQLKIVDVPLITINHTYDTMEMYSKQVVSGGKGITYSADNIWIIGRRQVKDKDGDGKDVSGFEFIINVDKSRFVKEKSSFEVEVSWENGISKYSGLLPIALKDGYVVKPKQGWYEACNPETGEILSPNKLRKSDTSTEEFWNIILQNTDFAKYITNRYRMEQFNNESD